MAKERKIGELKGRTYKREYHKPTVEDSREIECLVDLGVQCLKMNRKPYFENTPEGLEEFKKLTFDFFETVNNHNRLADKEDLIIPDIEVWSTFLGITRQTLMNYEKDRQGEWSSFIRQVKDVIFACKKQLGLKNRLNGLVFILDSTNNHEYYNSNEFRVTQTVETKKTMLSINDLPKLEDIAEKDDTPRTFDLPDFDVDEIEIIDVESGEQEKPLFD